jgi:processive 1,2-diacylglycerol beta-glucosyltransferase
MPRVLVVTASYGSGHNAAAASLATAFEAAGADVTVLDHFRDLVHPWFDTVSRRLYYWILRRAPALWGVGYALGDRMPSDSPWTFGVTALGGPGLLRTFAALRPDVVVTVHATPAVVMSRLAGRGLAVPRHVTVVTDFVAHSQWITRHADRYCVAAPEVKREFVARGTAADRVVVTGVPIRPEFEQPVDRLGARRALGLPPGAPVVLAMAGAQGSFGRLAEIARVLVGAGVHGLIVTGEDARLAERLRTLTAGTPIRTFGHVPNVRLLMAAADLLVSKAGGMTLAEALAAELPLVIHGSLPGQERRNERFASRAGVALVARSPGELAAAVARALAEPGVADRLRARMRRLGRPDASRRVVGVVLDRARR